MMDKKATDDDVRVGVMKLLGEDALRILTQYIWNWRVVHGFQWSCGCLEDQAQSYKTQRPSHIRQRH